MFEWWSVSSRKGKNCSLGLEESYLPNAKEVLYKTIDIPIPHNKRIPLSWVP